jgi:hypothetical protein
MDRKINDGFETRKLFQTAQVFKHTELELSQKFLRFYFSASSVSVSEIFARRPRLGY